MTDKKLKILCVPHAPATKLRTRGAELARSLAEKGHQVDYAIIEVGHNDESSFSKIKRNIGSILPIGRIKFVQNNVNYTLFPYWLRNQDGFGQFVQKMAGWAIKNQGYDLIITSASSIYSMAKSPRTKIIYDLVDFHFDSKYEKDDIAQYILNYIQTEMGKADAVIASGLVLKDVVKNHFNREAILVPNGANMNEIRSYVDAHPDSRSLSNPVVGYVGSLDSWVKLEVVIEAVRILREKIPQLTMTIVGGGDALNGVNLPDWVNFPGLVSPEEVPKYLSSFNVGVLPFELSDLTHAALPLKIIEYGSAKLPAVASPLEELTRHKFPWVKLTPLDKDEFAKAIEEQLAFQWEENFDNIVGQFTWEKGADKILDLAKDLGLY